MRRAEEMATRKLMSQEDIDKRRMQANVDNAKLDSARVRLGKAAIRAPFTGVAGLRKVSPGAYVKAGDSLVDLVQLDPLKLDFNAPEALTSKVATGQAVRVSVAAYPDQWFNATVYAIEPQVELSTRSVPLRATLPNGDRYFWPGQFVKVRVILTTRKGAVLVPTIAQQIGQQGPFVYVVKPDMTIEMRPIKAGQPQGDLTVIESGVNAGDQVVTVGQMMIQPGIKVQLMPPQPTASAGGGAAPSRGS